MIGWAVVGLGDITRKRVLPAIRDEPRSRIRALVTRDPAKARAECDNPLNDFAVERICSTLEDALADPEVTAVYIGTPVALHYPQTMAALAAGKHVLCEKPTALNPTQVETMVATARAADRHLGVSFYRRLYPAVNRAMELIREGAIGDPTLAWVAIHGWFEVEALQHRAWLFDPAVSGGGPLMDVGSHRIDLLNYMFGTPTLLSAGISRQTHKSPAYQVEDNATLTLEYRNGVRAVLDARWNSRVLRDEFRIIGTDGEIDLTPLNSGVIKSPRGEELLPPVENFHLPMIQHFVDVLENGAPLISSGATALETDRIMAEAYRKSA